MRTCIVIPHFDHFVQFEKMLPALMAQGFPLIVVDDASPDRSFDCLERLLDNYAPGTTLIRHAGNLGKGGAVMTGLRAALNEGFTHALQIDADGQHSPKDIPILYAAAQRHQDAIICGQPVFDESISTLRYYARYITLSFSWLESLCTEIRDALCGFRLYPLKRVVALMDNSTPGNRMAFDPEILVRALWADIHLYFVPVNVNYPDDGISHYRYIRDNVELSWMHTKLICGMLSRLPTLIRRNRTSRVRRAES